MALKLAVTDSAVNLTISNGKVFLDARVKLKFHLYGGGAMLIYSS
jgi:hypothetical protein